MGVFLLLLPRLEVTAFFMTPESWRHEEEIILALAGAVGMFQGAAEVILNVLPSPFDNFSCELLPVGLMNSHMPTTLFKAY